MKIFLTSSDIPEIPQPIECEVISGWEDWDNFDKVLVTIKPGFSVKHYGQSVRITQLALCRVVGNRSPDDFLKDHAWVDVFVPSRSDAGCEEEDWRLCVGIVHRTAAAAQRYLPRFPAQERNLA